MKSYQLEHTQDRNPLVNYAVKTMWGNPELDSQFQVKLSRVSGEQGLINNFSYMGKTRFLPTELNFYHVFTMGGLDSGFWNLGSRQKSWYPVDQWVRASTFSSVRGVSLDIYSGNGTMWLRTETYIMPCFDGMTLIAIPINPNFPLPLDKSLYFHCYTTDINTRNIASKDEAKYTFGYSGCIYIQHENFEKVTNYYNFYKSFNMGLVQFFHNGKIVPIETAKPLAGDLIEVVYDPSVEMVATYDYKGMPDYYSDLDSKRKVILFPGFDNRPHKYRYYDDCHFYIYNKRNKDGYYFHRNHQDAVRQLTHQDYGMAVPYIDFLAGRLITDDKTNNTTVSDIQIKVIYHKTRWQFDLGPTSSRINDLYLLEYPQDILNAMTGALSSVKEWKASELEKSATNKVLNGIVQTLTTDTVREALGHHGCSIALSNSPLYMPFITPGEPEFNDIYPTPPYTSGLGYQIPPTYVESSTAYEYDIDGLLLRRVGVRNQEWYQPKEGCVYVEWVLGQSGHLVDYVISKTDVKLREGFGFRVYRAKWVIDPNIDNTTKVHNELPISKTNENLYPNPDVGGEIRALTYSETPNDIPPTPPPMPDGGRPLPPWIDITGTDQYRIENGYIVWNFDTINNVGMVVFDTDHLYGEFPLSHIDNSLTFAITHEWDVGGPLLQIEPGQVDIWMNRHPLIGGVDYILNFPNVYIINKMWLVEGEQFIQWRATGLSESGLVNTSELGFVAEGVLGHNGRYNLRIDRPTKTILGGRLFLTSSLDWAEDINHGENVREWNGWPYEVKHIYTANKFVDKEDIYWGYNKSLGLDVTVGSYLTERVSYKKKDPQEIDYMESDKYRLFSPFLSQVVNEIVLGFLILPEPNEEGIPFSNQQIDDLTREYQWMLDFDPIVLDLDLKYFTVHPYSNLKVPTVTADQLTFITMVNDLYLKSKIKIEGHFEVKHV